MRLARSKSAITLRLKRQSQAPLPKRSYFWKVSEKSQTVRPSTSFTE
ncbi:hypothetical protein [Streptomyces paludis]|nr:hypothetical protein [Streptomyces paludis]